MSELNQTRIDEVADVLSKTIKQEAEEILAEYDRLLAEFSKRINGKT